MIGERIHRLRERAGLSQAELARRLSVTRSAVNAWESGLSAPTAYYIAELAKLFHISADFLLGIDAAESISLRDLSEDEISLLYQMLAYFDKRKPSD